MQKNDNNEMVQVLISRFIQAMNLIIHGWIMVSIALWSHRQLKSSYATVKSYRLGLLVWWAIKIIYISKHSYVIKSALRGTNQTAWSYLMKGCSACTASEGIGCFIYRNNKNYLVDYIVFYINTHPFCCIFWGVIEEGAITCL